MGSSTIKPGGGGDYLSLTIWEAAKQADLTGAGPEIANCYNGVDSTGVNINGWTTTAADYILIQAAGDGVHNGTSRDVSGAGYVLSNVAITTTILLSEDYVRFVGICIKQDSTQNCFLPQTITATNNDIRFNDCIIWRTANTVPNVMGGANTNLTMTNCVNYGTGYPIDSRNNASTTLRYCTHGTSYNFAFVTNTTDTITNCYGYGGTVNDFWSSGSNTGSYNASSDTSATTQFTNSLASKAASSQFVNASLGSSADFHLKTGAALIAAGTNVSGVTTDYEGSTRNGTTPDIGADEFVSASSGYTITLAAGGYTINGTAATPRVARNTAAAVGSCAITGTATGLKFGHKFAASAGSYAINGPTTNLVYSGSNRTLSADVGSYSISGVAASLKVARRIAENVGSYSVTGQTAALVVGRKITAGIGSYALSGVNTALKLGRKIQASSGNYTITGASIDITYSGVVGQLWTEQSNSTATWTEQANAATTWTIQ